MPRVPCVCPSEIMGVVASIALPPSASMASHTAYARSINLLLHGITLVYGTPTVMTGLRKSASLQPTARKLLREHVILTKEPGAPSGTFGSPVISKERFLSGCVSGTISERSSGCFGPVAKARVATLRARRRAATGWWPTRSFINLAFMPTDISQPFHTQSWPSTPIPTVPVPVKRNRGVQNRLKHWGDPG